ncbi:MAG: TIGR02253 family HAD-type hydrolase [Methanopyri archaeon]|nr:TIGR02253 family HAD-type hydrolase [Methanopyri archaeon]
MIRAVIFDLDDTLYPSSKLAREARWNAIRAMVEAGLDVDMTEEELYEELMGVVKEYGSNHPRHFDLLLKRVGVDPDPKLVAAAVVAYHDTKLAYLKPYPDVIPTLLWLKEKGLRLGVVTSGIPVKQWEKLIRLGIHHFFDDVVISEDVGVEKPNPRIFKIAVSRLGVAPSEALYVGDRPDRDVRGANRAGLVTVRVRQGKYRDLKPEREEDIPDFEIRRLRELKGVVERLLSGDSGENE